MELNSIYQPISCEMAALKESVKKEFAALAGPSRLKDGDLASYQGKNLRSAMFFLSYKIAGHKSSKMAGVNPAAVSIATAIELMHSASLYHDDVIDNAKLRRSGTSANVLYGNARAVLLGDSLFAKAFYILAKAGNSNIIEALSGAAREMSMGEITHTVNNLYPCRSSMTENEYFKIVEQKTASLFSGCCRCGALAGEADEGTLKALPEYGLKLGIAYQIIDDCIDLIGDEKTAGKTLKSDSTSGKFTLPIIYLQQELSHGAKILSEKYPRLLDIWQDHKELQNNAIKKTIGKIQSYIRDAKNSLTGIPESVYSKSLLGMADYVNMGFQTNDGIKCLVV